MAALLVCCGISFLFFVGCIIWGIRRKSGKSMVISGTAGVGGAVLIFRLFAFAQPLQGDFTARISSALLILGRSIVHTLQTFSLDEDYDFFLNVLREKCQPGVVLDLVTVYYTILNVLAPIMTLAFILTLLEELLSRFRASMHPSKETFLFSELNERALTLAEDVRKNKRRALLVFTNFKADEADEQAAELRERANRIGAICVKNDITTMRFRHCSSSPITFVLADMNEYENLRVAAWLSRGNKKLNRLVLADVLVFCTGNDAEITVQEAIKNRSNRNMRFVAVNDCVQPIYRLLSDFPLFSRMQESKPTEEGKIPKQKNPCTVLIVGCGYIGLECVKAISWCGQMADTELKIRVVSEDAAEKKAVLMKECPELFSTKLYDIDFQSVDVSGDAFVSYLNQQVRDACYVVVALGNDQRNITVSKELKRFYDRIYLQGGKAPQICYLVMDNSLFSTFSQKQEENARTNECLLVPFGNNKQRFSVESLLNSEMERVALAIHLTYWGLPVRCPESLLEKVKKSFLSGKRFDRATKDPQDQAVVSRRYELCLFYRCFPRFWRLAKIHCALVSFFTGKKPAEKELREQLAAREGAISSYNDSIYGQNSSRSSAVHLRYKIFAAGLAADGKITDRTLDDYSAFIADEKNCIAIAKLEHLRWDAYMRSIGYVAPKESEFESYAYCNGNTHVQKELRLHPCLVDWNEEYDKVLVPEDYELYENQDPAFMSGRYLRDLDDLDRVSLKVWLTRKQRKGKTALIDYKTTDEIIIKNASEILRTAAKNAEMI